MTDEVELAVSTSIIKVVDIIHNKIWNEAIEAAANKCMKLNNPQPFVAQEIRKLKK